MRKTQIGFKVLGMSLLAAICLMACTAAGAQAEEFRVSGKTFTAQSIASETFDGTIEKTEFSVAWLGFALTCSSGTVSGTMFKGGSINASAEFSGCVIPGNANCTIYEEEGEGGAGQIYIQGSGSLVLHAGSHYAKFASPEFTTLFIVGAKCTLQEEMVASGSAAMRVPSALTELVNQQFVAVSSKSEGALLGVSVQCAGEPAAILGSGGSLQLTGANVGKAWGFE